MTKKIVKKLKRPFNIRESIKDLMRLSPMLGYIIVKMKYEFVPDDHLVIKTMAISKECKLMINKKFAKSLSDKEMVAVLKHESLHIGHKHWNRLINVSQPFIAEIAKEISINQYVNDLPGKEYPTVESFGFDKGLSLEKYYKLLVDWAEKNPDKCQQIGNGNPLKGDASEVGKGAKLAEKICREAKDYAKSIGSETGLGEEGIQIVPTNYRAKINKLISYQTSQTKLKRTNLKRSRRFKNSPGLKKTLEMNDIIFGLDTSGSMSERELGLAVDAMKKFRSKCSRLTLIQGDTQVTDIGRIKKNISTLKVKGRGGTELTPIVNKAKEFGYPKVPLVMFTDGEVDGYPKYLKNSLWIFTNEEKAIDFSQKRPGIPYAIML